MKKILLITFLISSLFNQSLAQGPDADGCKDSPLFSRMPNYWIPECTKNYDEFVIPMAEDKEETKEGMKTYISYDFDDDAGQGPSFFQIVKNYENAVVKMGGKKIFYLTDNWATFFAKSGNKDIWVVIKNNGSNNFSLNILEIEAMKQEIDAGAMMDALNKDGFIALQINFETGKSEIKPESQKIVDQIAAMLKANPTLKVSIEGHTDNVGVAASNKTLSENRAKAVVNALVAKGIDKARLTSKGWGQEKPVAVNTTEDGKAKNRRVEIVKQ